MHNEVAVGEKFVYIKANTWETSQPRHYVHTVHTVLSGQ